MRSAVRRLCGAVRRRADRGCVRARARHTPHPDSHISLVSVSHAVSFVLVSVRIRVHARLPGSSGSGRMCAASVRRQSCVANRCIGGSVRMVGGTQTPAADPSVRWSTHCCPLTSCHAWAAVVFEHHLYLYSRSLHYLTFRGEVPGLVLRTRKGHSTACYDPWHTLSTMEGSAGFGHR